MHHTNAINDKPDDENEDNRKDDGDLEDANEDDDIDDDDDALSIPLATAHETLELALYHAPDACRRIAHEAAQRVAATLPDGLLVHNDGFQAGLQQVNAYYRKHSLNLYARALQDVVDDAAASKLSASHAVLAAIQIIAVHGFADAFEFVDALRSYEG